MLCPWAKTTTWERLTRNCQDIQEIVIASKQELLGRQKGLSRTKVPTRTTNSTFVIQITDSPRPST